MEVEGRVFVGRSCHDLSWLRPALTQLDDHSVVATPSSQKNAQTAAENATRHRGYRRESQVGSLELLRS